MASLPSGKAARWAAFSFGLFCVPGWRVAWFCSCAGSGASRWRRWASPALWERLQPRRGILVIRSFLPWRRHHSALTGRHEGARSRLKPLPQCNYQRSREFSDGSGGGECMLLLVSSPCPGAPKRKPAQPTANARAPSTNPNTAAQRAPRFTQEPHQPDKRRHPEGQLTATPDPRPRSSPAWRTGSPTGCRPAAATAPPIAPPPAAGRGFRPRPRPGRGSAGCPGPSPAA